MSTMGSNHKGIALKVSTHQSHAGIAYVLTRFDGKPFDSDSVHLVAYAI